MKKYQCLFDNGKFQSGICFKAKSDTQARFFVEELMTSLFIKSAIIEEVV